ncbi:asparagine synthase (glutamine-hydrolyzing) [Glycomyces sp. NPDC047369]
MCGFAGWVSFGRDLGGHRPEVEAMTATMACRGPDAAGVWIDGPAALGHRRLAVIDVEGGAQPMRADTPDGAVAVVYAGETYNYTELREELRRRGHRFGTESDTEVVLRGYLEWGAAVAERMNGMFAFAVWDARTRELTMVRDRMGVKPFFYAPTDDGVVFGSEPKALLANPLVEPAVDAEGLRPVVALVDSGGNGFWRGMRKVEPGSVVTVSANGIRTRRYWTLATAEHTDDLDATVATVRELLEDIVARQLVADVPLCSLLSGGLDSSALAALAARRSPEPLRTFAVSFTAPGEAFIPDALSATHDAAFARELAAHAGTDHHEIVLDPGGLADPDLRAAALRAFDVPLGYGDVATSLHLLFKAVREHSTVALSGESADEVFAGYRWTHSAAREDRRTFPWLALAPDRSAALRKEVRDALDLPAYVQSAYEDAAAAVVRLDGESDLDFRMREVSHLHLTNLLRLLLDRKDRLSMATGLEVRVPFCDHRLVEYVHNVPWAMKTFDGREKSLLRAAVADLLPESIVQRAKSHYPQANDAAYSAALRLQARDRLADPGHAVFDLVDPDWLATAAGAPDGLLPADARLGIELALDLAAWIDGYAPELRIA